MFPKRVGDWSGAEPQELLNNARAAQSGVAVGRFASYAAEPVVDPLTELHMASTSSLLDRSAEQKRLKIGAQHGRSVAQLSKSVPAPAALVATNKSGMLVDHSASAKIGRKRARDGQLGREGDCPQLQRLCWKWTGETSAASACWMDDGGLSFVLTHAHVVFTSCRFSMSFSSLVPFSCYRAFGGFAKDQVQVRRCDAGHQHCGRLARHDGRWIGCSSAPGLCTRRPNVRHVNHYGGEWIICFFRLLCGSLRNEHGGREC